MNPAIDPLALVPQPPAHRLALRVTPAGQRAVRQGHPWLFEEAVTHQSREGKPGDLAVVFDDYRRFLAIGLFDPTSPIRVRILQHTATAVIDHDWLRDRLAAAMELRSPLLGTNTTGYRVVHGENDGLPGVVVDRYEQTLVVKLYSLAWVPWLAQLRSIVTAAFPQASVVLRLSRDVLRHPEDLYGLTDGVTLAGEPVSGPVLFRENGLYFEADVLQGQKTGFFLDQRDNRARVERLAAGRRTLNVFAYSGGFSLYAARGGAPEIVSLDLSTAALAAAGRNFERNRHVPAIARATHRVLVGDAFDALADMRRRGERFALVVVDPPSFAKREAERDRALRSYYNLARLAIGVLAPRGTLVASSCSSRVSAADFFATVGQAAADAGRPLRTIERTGHALDHPVGFPEGAYLKCLFATVP